MIGKIPFLKYMKFWNDFRMLCPESPYYWKFKEIWQFSIQKLLQKVIFSDNFCDSWNKNKYFTSTGYIGAKCTIGRLSVWCRALVSSTSPKFTNEITDVTEVSYLGFSFKDIMIEMNKKCPDLSPTKEPYCLVIKIYTKFLRQIYFFKHSKHSK